MPFNVQEYQTDLATALRSFDKEELIAFFTKYKMPTPSNDQTFWARVHKMRLGSPEFTEEEKQFSRAWLSSHGFKASFSHNLQKHLGVFGKKLLELKAQGLDEEDAGLAAAKEANEQYPLSDEDKEILTAGGKLLIQ